LVQECGLQFAGNFVNDYAPINCLVQVRNAAIAANNAATDYQTNPFFAFSDISNAMTAFNNMKVLCPFMALLNQTQTS